jgi:hypothetical protein
MNEIILPIESNNLDIESYPHCIFRYRLDGLGTFIGEVLLSMGFFEKKYIYKTSEEIRFKPKLYLNDMPEENRKELIDFREKHGRTEEIMEQTSWFHEEPVKTPEFVWKPRSERQNLCGDLLRGLFFSAVTQLVSIYEIFIADLAKEIFRNNHELLAIPEKQLSSEKIIRLESYEKIIDELIDRAIRKFTYGTSYPKLVERFQTKFHIGIHDRNSPAQLFAVHHLIEKRNIIVHNDGVASSTYIERMKNYGNAELIKEDDEVIIDFTKFYNDLVVIRELGEYIETCVQTRWPNLQYFK